MNCPTCHHLIPEALLACPGCLEARSLTILKGMQREPLLAVQAGRQDLIIRTIHGLRHIQMFGADVVFCGIHVGLHRKAYLKYDPALPAICTACRGEFRTLMGEAALVQK